MTRTLGCGGFEISRKPSSRRRHLKTARRISKAPFWSRVGAILKPPEAFVGFGSDRGSARRRDKPRMKRLCFIETIIFKEIYVWGGR